MHFFCSGRRGALLGLFWAPFVAKIWKKICAPVLLRIPFAKTMNSALFWLRAEGGPFGTLRMRLLRRGTILTDVLTDGRFKESGYMTQERRRPSMLPWFPPPLQPMRRKQRTTTHAINCACARGGVSWVVIGLTAGGAEK